MTRVESLEYSTQIAQLQPQTPIISSEISKATLLLFMIPPETRLLSIAMMRGATAQ